MDCEGFHVRITREAYEKIMTYIELCPLEISGFGRTVVQEDGILIQDAFLIKQEVSPATTDMDPESLFQAVMDAASAGEDTSDWGCWFHSHVNFGANFSGTDTDTMEKLKADSPLVSLVLNKRGEYSLRVDIYKPFRLTMTGLRLEVIYPPSDDMRASVRTEIMEKVRQRKFTQAVLPPNAHDLFKVDKFERDRFGEHPNGDVPPDYYAQPRIMRRR